MAARDVPHTLADAAVVITLSLDRAAQLERARAKMGVTAPSAGRAG
jgi:hypothetical protein